MDNGPLVSEEIDEGAKLVREFDHYAPIKAAFWLRRTGEEQRYLYLASDQIDDSNFGLAYGEVGRIVNLLDSPDLDRFRVKVIGGDHPLALAAAEMIASYPGRKAPRLGGCYFGGMGVEDVYFYPMPIPVAI